MRKITLFLLLAILAASSVAQSGRKNVRSRTEPLPPVQAPVWTAPDPEPEPIALFPAPVELRALPDSLRQRSIKSLDDSSFRLADFEGKIVVLNLWASWCGPCRAEVPEYEKVRKEYVGRNVEFVGLTGEDPRTSAERVRQFARKHNFGFRLGWADRETEATLMNGHNGVPQTLVVAPDGRVMGHWTGYDRRNSGDRLRKIIERVLSESGGQ